MKLTLTPATFFAGLWSRSDDKLKIFLFYHWTGFHFKNYYFSISALPFALATLLDNSMFFLSKWTSMKNCFHCGDSNPRPLGLVTSMLKRSHIFVFRSRKRRTSENIPDELVRDFCYSDEEEVMTECSAALLLMKLSCR